jgi:hypothetical protein
MKRWVRRSLIWVGGALAVALVLSVVGLRMFRASPAWYGEAEVPEAQREHYANAAENKMIRAQNWAQELRADEVRLARASESGASRPATRAAGEMTFALDQREINALLDKWSVMHGWKRQYEKFIDRPRVLLRDNSIIFAGRVSDINSVVSFQLLPGIDQQGRLNFELVRVMGGKLPLPESFWGPWRDKAAAEIDDRLPTLRRQANISPTGAANSSAMAAVMGNLFLKIAQQQPVDAIVFLPLAEKNESVPVRITSIDVADGELSISVQSLTAAQRTALLNRIKN